MHSRTLGTRGLVPDRPTIAVQLLGFTQCDAIQTILNLGSGAQILGASLRFTSRGTIDTIALATSLTVFLIDIGKGGSPSRGRSAKDGTSLPQVLENPRCMLAGFRMADLALLLHRQTAAHIYGLNLSTLWSGSDRVQESAADLASKRLSQHVPRHRIHALWLSNSKDDLCLRAWLSACIAERSLDAIKDSLKVNTRNLQNPELECLAQLVLNTVRLDADKPQAVENDFEKVDVNSKAGLVLHNSRFKTRVRRSEQTIIEINGGEVKAHAYHVNGKRTGLMVLQGKLQGKVEKVRVLGREEPTSAELARDEFLLHVMQGVVSLQGASFVRMLWFPGGGKKGKKGAVALKGSKQQVSTLSFEALNASQKQVAHAMVGDARSLVIAHGPPGTGKTSTIAAALEYWQASRQQAWVIAHSNVGVKNIAESLLKRKIDFKLIVSKEFHFEWHEHIYGDIDGYLIRSDDFGDAFDPKNYIGDTKIILCTLSMLSNPILDLCGVYQYIPVERLVVDEASQIDTFEFMHLFHKFVALQKVCMFGDPKQLPPFGKEAAPKMKTIFDFKHLAASAYFLDTQYRMPVPLGDFISKAVYEAKLKSVHRITAPSCVRFVDVRKGKEEHVGSSWKNVEEIHTIVNIVKMRYQYLDFCVITPYDAQRAAIAATLEAANLPFENVFNVDSFQGHEAPYVIVSVVRTTKPGFLRSLNRMNVMLTRCKAGMIIVTQQAFLRGSGKSTLLGGLASHWESLVGAKSTWVDAMAIANGKAPLPGDADCSSVKKDVVLAGASRRTMVSLSTRMSALSLID